MTISEMGMHRLTLTITMTMTAPKTRKKETDSIYTARPPPSSARHSRAIVEFLLAASDMLFVKVAIVLSCDARYPLQYWNALFVFIFVTHVWIEIVQTDSSH